MTFDYCCSKNQSGTASWKEQVRLITTVNPYEMTVTARKSCFHIIYCPIVVTHYIISAIIHNYWFY